MSERWDDQSAFRTWLPVLARRKWVVLLAVITVPVVALLVSHSQQRLYEASATVLVNEQNTAAADLNLGQGITSPPDRYAATQAVLARAGTVAEMAVRAAKVPGVTAAELLADSSVTADPTADVLTFSVTNPSATAAEKLATSYGAQFSAYRQQRDSTALGAAIANVRRRLASLAASGQGRSPLAGHLAGTERDLESIQALQTPGSSAALVGPAGGASIVQPKTNRNVILGLLVGLALGLGLAYLLESVDTRVRSADELRGRLGLPLLGHLPRPARHLAQAQRLATLWEPVGVSAEAFRVLKTNLDVTQLQHPVGSIVITSTTEGEGKSTTAANLAVMLARSGRHVILVDLDLRHPGIDRFFDLGGRPGLSSVAVGDVELADALSLVDVSADNRTADAGLLEVVTVGLRPPDPGEFLSSGFINDTLEALAARCDVLLVDAPPMLAGGDALAIATRTDALILVARLNQVRRAALAETRRLLDTSPALKLGFIATGSDAGARYPYPNAGSREAPDA